MRQEYTPFGRKVRRDIGEPSNTENQDKLYQEDSMKKKVYIAGKIGEDYPSEATLLKFDRAELFLLSIGCNTFNPTRSGLGEKAESMAKKKGTDFYREIMLLDLEALAGCDAIYMLPDWIESPGAIVEFNFALAIGLEVMYENYDKNE